MKTSGQMDVDVQRRPEELCGRRRRVEKLSLVDVDQ